jgi:hypothetical protein
VAWDSTGIDTPDTEANAVEFGRAGGAGHPQLRLLTLLECGTHALLGAVFDGYDRASEPALARRLLDRLEPGMLLLADRNFPGYELWGLAAATGADLVWRLKKNRVFVPVRRLPTAVCAPRPSGWPRPCSTTPRRRPASWPSSITSAGRSS